MLFHVEAKSNTKKIDMLRFFNYLLNLLTEKTMGFFMGSLMYESLIRNTTVSMKFY